MSKLSDYLDTLDVHVDGTYRGDCPMCYGRNTFTVTNERGNLLYNCYKAGCAVHGAKHTNMDAFTIKTLLSQAQQVNTSYEQYLTDAFDMPPYMSPVTQDNEAVRSFMTKWNIDPDDVMYDIRQDRIVFPVYTEGNVLVDAVGRALDGRQPKWLRYASSPVPYVHGTGNIAILVEDAISAYVIGEQFPNLVGVALLGTQLTDFHKWYIGCRWGEGTVYVALDRDARDKTLSIMKELRPLVKKVQGLNLSDDLKYLHEDDVKVLEEINAEMLYGRG